VFFRFLKDAGDSSSRPAPFFFARPFPFSLLLSAKPSAERYFVACCSAFADYVFSSLRMQLMLFWFSVYPLNFSDFCLIL